MKHICKKCKTEFYSWSTLQTKCHKCQPKIKQVGKETERYNTWREEIARPYVVNRDGFMCSDCRQVAGRDLHHLKGRRENKYNLDELRYLCRSCHQKRHNVIM